MTKLALLLAAMVVGASCASTPSPDSPTTSETSSASQSPTTTSTPEASGNAEAPKGKRKHGVHPTDAEGHLVYRKSAGTCYVQAPKKDPPKDLMPGERWVEDQTIPCPKEFDEPAFAAIADGWFWMQDEATGECMQQRSFGDPPPPATKVACPPSLVKK